MNFAEMKQIIKKFGLSQKQTALNCNVPYQYMNQFLSGRWNLIDEHIERLSRYLEQFNNINTIP